MKDKMYWDWEKSDFIDADIKQELKGVSCSAEMVIELQKLKIAKKWFDLEECEHNQKCHKI